jgi:hypothetical protein
MAKKERQGTSSALRILHSLVLFSTGITIWEGIFLALVVGTVMFSFKFTPLRHLCSLFLWTLMLLDLKDDLAYVLQLSGSEQAFDKPRGPCSCYCYTKGAVVVSGYYKDSHRSFLHQHPELATIYLQRPEHYTS